MDNAGENIVNKWHKRWHPLREEWIVYSAHRNSRPWQGAELISPKSAPSYDPQCYLCPGNKRIHGQANPSYRDVYIFDNDHPVVGSQAPLVKDISGEELYRKSSALGRARVVCYDPRHNVTLSQMKTTDVVRVFDAFRDEMIGFEKDPLVKFVLIFENRGEAVGVSNPHPHCQIYGTDFTFKLVDDQLRIAKEHKDKWGTNIFEDIIQQEVADKLRIVAENKNAIAFIPFFARYAYEIMIFPRKAHATLISMSKEELADLAEVFQTVVRKLDMNYQMTFPYVMSIMQAPVDGNSYNDFRLHIWLQPPYRQPGLIKYLAGPEIGGGNFMADTIPEDKATELNNIDVSTYPDEK
jgi:UDPglucose--hexose-1-phosphate uridylyltransferase